MLCKNFLRYALPSLAVRHIFNLTYQARLLQVFFTIYFVGRGKSAADLTETFHHQ
ncbi:MAG: hypothetical protein LH614_21295 [Pyrinomonadaceae bacterium]|nr:hypothetical protein [Pyrinomonadaceae bacterium]